MPFAGPPLGGSMHKCALHALHLNLALDLPQEAHILDLLLGASHLMEIEYFPPGHFLPRATVVGEPGLERFMHLLWDLTNPCFSFCSSAVIIALL